jgi:prevent-host-death family protein
MSIVIDPLPADAAFADAIARAESGQERIILTRAGKPVMALVPVADLEAIEDAEDQAAAAQGLAEYEQSGQDWPVLTVETLATRWGIDLADDATM